MRGKVVLFVGRSSKESEAEGRTARLLAGERRGEGFVVGFHSRRHKAPRASAGPVQAKARAGGLRRHLREGWRIAKGLPGGGRRRRRRWRLRGSASACNASGGRCSARSVAGGAVSGGGADGSLLQVLRRRRLEAARGILQM